MDQVIANMGVLDGLMTKQPLRDWLAGGDGKGPCAPSHRFGVAHFGTAK